MSKRLVKMSETLQRIDENIANLTKQREMLVKEILEEVSPKTAPVAKKRGRPANPQLLSKSECRRVAALAEAKGDLRVKHMAEAKLDQLNKEAAKPEVKPWDKSKVNLDPNRYENSALRGKIATSGVFVKTRSANDVKQALLYCFKSALISKGLNGKILSTPLTAIPVEHLKTLTEAHLKTMSATPGDDVKPPRARRTSLQMQIDDAVATLRGERVIKFCTRSTERPDLLGTVMLTQKGIESITWHVAEQLETVPMENTVKAKAVFAGASE
jgi:hypothetical protein